jgi:uncharacterized protein with FMN-binding domain
MKTGRSVILVTASASMLVAGWAAGSGLVSAQGATSSASGANLGAAQGASGTSSSSTGTSAKGSPSAPATSAPATSAPAKSAPAKSAATASGKFKGSTVRTRYGNFQVQITVTAGKITDISMLQSGSQDGTSQQITGYALPQLIQAVLQQQKANVGYVSGASYTTQGFEGAVQSAMKVAGLA